MELIVAIVIIIYFRYAKRCYEQNIDSIEYMGCKNLQKRYQLQRKKR